MTKEQILAEAMTLDSQQRDELIEDLQQFSTHDELTAEQSAELRRRVDAMDRGETTMIPGEQVMQEIRSLLSKRR